MAKRNELNAAPSGRYRVFRGGNAPDPDVFDNLTRAAALSHIRRALAARLPIEVLDDLDPVELFAWDPVTEEA
jgi:hypothetical protein